VLWNFVMSVAPGDETSTIAWLLTSTLPGLCAGFVGGLAVAAAELSTGFAPLESLAPLFAVSGARSATCLS
jgi:hypothetical protein